MDADATQRSSSKVRSKVVMGGCFSHPASVSRASLRLSHKLSGSLKAGIRLAWDADTTDGDTTDGDDTP